MESPAAKATFLLIDEDFILVLTLNGTSTGARVGLIILLSGVTGEVLPGIGSALQDSLIFALPSLVVTSVEQFDDLEDLVSLEVIHVLELLDMLCNVAEPTDWHGEVWDLVRQGGDLIDANW